MPRNKFYIAIIGTLLGGIVIGGYLFHDTRPRSFLGLPHCTTSCLSTSELKGLLVSVGIQKVSAYLPNVVQETDKVVAIKSPEPLARVDYLILPKKDIRDLGDLSSDDAEYIDDSFQVMASLIRDKNLKDYKVITNGPGFQQINYLHFHLLAQ